MQTPLTEADRGRIIETIRAAESNTAGEIYVVVARHADEFRFVPVLWGALSSLVIVWPLLLLTNWPTHAILIVQAFTFVGVALLASHPSLRHRLVPARLAQEASREDALAQFMAHGLHLTEHRTGVLIYTAVLDRRVEIVADAGIDRHVDQAFWDQLASEIAAGARSGLLADALVSAVARVGGVLSEHFPPAPADRNELPDRVVEI
jgi:putative membrane protein